MFSSDEIEQLLLNRMSLDRTYLSNYILTCFRKEVEISHFNFPLGVVSYTNALFPIFDDFFIFDYNNLELSKIDFSTLKQNYNFYKLSNESELKKSLKICQNRKLKHISPFTLSGTYVIVENQIKYFERPKLYV